MSKEGDGESFAPLISKEEKEELLNRKMEDIRRKNEERLKRHKEVEADRQAAVQSNRMVNLKSPAEEEDRKDNTRETRHERQPHDNNHMQHEMRGVNNNERSEERKGKFSAGRGKRLQNMSKEKLKAKDYERNIKGPQGPQKPNPEEENEDGPPPDPGFNFLADRSREGPSHAERSQQQQQRHPRNFGGGDFNNIPSKMRYEKEKQGQYGKRPPKSKMEMSVNMTGRERREYQSWKDDRQKIDQERIDRQKKEGTWRREWDQEKLNQESYDSRKSNPEPPPSRRTEPGRRPAGRIGSGRFLIENAEEESQTVTTPSVPKEPQHERNDNREAPRPTHYLHDERFDASQPYEEITNKTFYNSSRGGRGGRGAPRPGRGGNRGQRLSSQSSDDGSRHVEEQDDKLVIKIDNEFSGRGGGSPRRPQGRHVGSGRFRNEAEQERVPDTHGQVDGQSAEEEEGAHQWRRGDYNRRSRGKGGQEMEGEEGSHEWRRGDNNRRSRGKGGQEMEGEEGSHEWRRGDNNRRSRGKGGEEGSHDWRRGDWNRGSRGKGGQEMEGEEGSQDWRRGDWNRGSRGKGGQEMEGEGWGNRQERGGRGGRGGRGAGRGDRRGGPRQDRGRGSFRGDYRNVENYDQRRDDESFYQRRGSGRGGERGRGQPRGQRKTRGGKKSPRDTPPKVIGTALIEVGCKGTDIITDDQGWGAEHQEFWEDDVVPAGDSVLGKQVQITTKGSDTTDQPPTAASADAAEAEERHTDDLHGDEEDYEDDGQGHDESWESVDDDAEFYEMEGNQNAEGQELNFQEDSHNSSAESLERFIQEHTLKLSTDGGITTTDGQITSPDTMKTPVDHVKILDWGAAMEELSDGNGSLPVSDSSLQESPQKDLSPPTEGAAKAVRKLEIKEEGADTNPAGEEKKSSEMGESNGSPATEKPEADQSIVATEPEPDSVEANDCQEEKEICDKPEADQSEKPEEDQIEEGAASALSTTEKKDTKTDSNEKVVNPDGKVEEEDEDDFKDAQESTAESQAAEADIPIKNEEPVIDQDKEQSVNESDETKEAADSNAEASIEKEVEASGDTNTTQDTEPTAKAEEPNATPEADQALSSESSQPVLEHKASEEEENNAT